MHLRTDFSHFLTVGEMAEQELGTLLHAAFPEQFNLHLRREGGMGTDYIDKQLRPGNILDIDGYRRPMR